MNLTSQEQSPAIIRLRQLLRAGLTVPVKTEAQWCVFENELFARVDALPPAIKARRPSHHWFFPNNFLLPPARFAVAAVALICVLGASLFVAERMHEVPPHTALAAAAILDATGISHADLPLAQGSRIQTNAVASAMVRLSKDIGFLLEPNSSIRIVHAGKRGFTLALENGSGLFSLRPLGKHERFVVQTPQARCRVVGTVFSVTIQQNSQATPASTHLAVFKGCVAMSSSMPFTSSAHVYAGNDAVCTGTTLQTQLSTQASEAPVRSLSLLSQALALSDSINEGIVEITSSPSGAAVAINGIIAGNTPLILRHAAGNYPLAVKASGYAPWQNTMTITPGHTSIATAVLTPLPASPVTHKRARKSAAKPIEDSEEFNRPEYVEAAIQMTIGEYAKALAVLEPLKGNPDLSPRERIGLYERIAECYRGIGNFATAITALEERLSASTTAREQSQVLWEMANIHLSCRADFRNAGISLERYLTLAPHGPWSEDARRYLDVIKSTHTATP